jgi:hypothetical protein
VCPFCVWVFESKSQDVTLNSFFCSQLCLDPTGHFSFRYTRTTFLDVAYYIYFIINVRKTVLREPSGKSGLNPGEGYLKTHLPKELS